MKNFTNQRGLAVLEVVIVAAIVAIFATAAVPKMARILDKAQLDYEMKHLYSTLNLARSVGKNSKGNVQFFVSKKNNKYHILSQTEFSSVKHYEHFLPKKFDLNYNGNSDVLQITFDNPSKYSEGGSRTITLTSSFGFKNYIYFDTVGRWRGSYEKIK